MRILPALVLLAACSTKSDRSPRSEVSVTQRTPESDKHEDASTKLPELRYEAGKCWLTVEPLLEAQLARVRTEFEARNRAWKVREIDAFTGAVRSAELTTPDSMQEPIELSDDKWEHLRLEPLRRNVDFLGLSEGELSGLTWDPTPGVSVRAGDHASVLRDDPALRAMGSLTPTLEVEVRYRNDGLVQSFAVKAPGPPVAICVEPVLDQAGAWDAVRVQLNPDLSRCDQKSQLSIAAGHNSPARTWLLIWALRCAYAAYRVDAITGHVLKNELYDHYDPLNGL